MASLEFPPAAFEVEDQLQRMLTGPRFSNAPNPSAFLELTVHRALAGQDTRGQTIARALFDGKIYAGLSSDVRTTASNLRKTLTRYYENEGASDVVIIEYAKPPEDKTIKPVEGKAYTPGFRYNPKHEPFILLRIAYRSLANQTYRDFYRALNIITGILANDAENPNALLGLVETVCKFAERTWMPSFSEWNITEGLLQQIGGVTMAQPVAVDFCKNILSKLSKVDGNYWRYWAVRASFLQERGLPGAPARYEKALKLDRLATESYPPYWYFLVESDRRDEAVGLAQRHCNANVEDSFAISEYGRLLCAAGRREVGIGHLQAALTIDPGNCSALQSLAVLRFMEKDIPDLASLLRALKTYADSETFNWFMRYLQEHERQFDAEGVIAKLMSEIV